MMTYDVGIPGPSLGQAQKYGRVKPINGIPTSPSRLLDLQWEIFYFHGSPTYIYIFVETCCDWAGVKLTMLQYFTVWIL